MIEHIHFVLLQNVAFECMFQINHLPRFGFIQLLVFVRGKEFPSIPYWLLQWLHNKEYSMMDPFSDQYLKRLATA